MNVEICINSSSETAVSQTAYAAFLGGADRIELCAEMHLHGLTPPLTHITAARQAFPRSGLLVMIRPRAGDFCYTPAEIAVMCQQIEQAATAGADGVVLGALERDGRLADHAMPQLIHMAKTAGLQVTCHRAFDATPNHQEALAQLIEWGVARVLTAGIPWEKPGTFLDGMDQIGQTIQLSRGKIEVVIGGGVNATTIPLLQQLPLYAGNVSVHAYSGAQVNGVTTVEAIQTLVHSILLFQ